jgi:3-dehydroquinate synthase
VSDRRGIRVAIHEQRDASYDVFVGRGTLALLPALLRETCPATRYAIIADHKAADLHGAPLTALLEGAGLAAHLVQFPSGEWNKSREQWSELTDRLLAAELGRDSAVIAFGGGVAGDLAGFVAATYLRGIPYVQVPTTLLAMIDSSIGGKTGVDVAAGKNLVGAFHQPRAVVADVELLATLPKPQIAAGLAEAIKHGVIRDAAYLASLEDPAPLLARDLDRLAAAVRRSVEIKAAVVAEDEREAGVRSILNFGHTVAHAVEARSGYELLHGEAVAIGMCVEATLAEQIGVAEHGLAARIRSALERSHLPVTLPENITTDSLLESMHADKKARAGRLRCALPLRCGTMAQGRDGEWTHEVSDDVMRDTLERGRD